MKAVLYGKSQSASQAEQPPERAVTTMNELDQTLIEPSHEAEGESHKTEDREVVKEGVSEEEQKKKMELWEAANGDWIRQQEEKRKEKEARGAKMTKRKKKVNVGHRTWIILRIGLSIVIL